MKNRNGLWPYFLSKIFMIMPLVLSLNSCMVGPDFETPCVPMKYDWIDEGNVNVKVTEEQLCDWWEVFNDPLLDHLIFSAYQQNLTLEIASHRILEARAKLGIAIGRFFPQQQQAFGSSTRNKLSESQANIGATPDIYFRDYQLGLQAAWEIDFWGKYRRAIESESSELFASIANYDDVLVLLLSDVATVYVRIRALQERIAIVKGNIKVQFRSVEITQANFEGGFVSELDVQQATTLLRATEAQLPELEKQLRQAQNALSVLLGIPPEDLSDLFGSEGKIPSAAKDIFVSVPEALLYRRPDIRRALYVTAAQSARIGVAFSDFFPQISLVGTIGYRSSDSTNNVTMGGGKLLDRSSLTFSYGPSFVWPLLNYGRIYNAVQVERERFYQAVFNYQNTVLTAYQDVEDGLIAFLKSQEQEKIVTESVTAAKRAVSLANTQYIEGLVDYTRVLNTLESQLEEEERLAISRENIALGLIATYKALGGGFELKYR